MFDAALRPGITYAEDTTELFWIETGEDPATAFKGGCPDHIELKSRGLKKMYVQCKVELWQRVFRSVYLILLEHVIRRVYRQLYPQV